MWFAPSNFAQASGCSPKAFTPDCDTSDSPPALWVTSSGTPTLRQPSWPGWKRRPWSRLLYGPETLRMSDGSNGMAQWIASLRDFPANRTAWLEAEKESKTTAGYGKASQTAFASLAPGSLCWKTYPGFDLLGECPPYSQTWPRSGSVSNGTACERPTWAPATSANGCLSWATPDCNTSTRSNGLMGPNILEQAAKWTTPQAHDVTERGSGQQPSSKAGNACLARDARTWSTPNAHDRRRPGADTKSTQGMNLSRDAATWPTPASRDAKGENSQQHMSRTDGRTGKNHADQLPNFVAHLFYSHQDQTMTDGLKSYESAPISPRRRLNPNFAEWLMGWPPGWSTADPTACDASETALWRCRLQSQLCILVGGSD